MNRHSQDYLELNPEPVEPKPGPLVILAGAAFTMLTLWVITVFLFFL